MAQEIMISKHLEGEPIPTDEEQRASLTQKMHELQMESMQDQWAENSKLSQQIKTLEKELELVISNPELALEQEYKAHTETKMKLAQAENEIEKLTKRLTNFTATVRKKIKKARQQKPKTTD